MGDPFYIISIDGGGFRGVFAAHILARIEKAFDLNWCNKFRIMAGTSTGAIIAAALACGHDASKICELYELHGNEIFQKRKNRNAGIFSSRYYSDFLNAKLKEIFEDRKLGDLKTPLIIPATDIGNGNVHVFKSAYDPEFVRDLEVPIKDAVLASCSAPTYFDPEFIYPYLLADGGLWANSPSLIAVIDSHRRLNQNLDDVRVLSIGTGVSKSFYNLKKLWWKKFFGWGFVTRWGRQKFIAMIMNLQSENATNMTSLLLGRDHVYRINFDSDASLPLDDPREYNDLVTKADRYFSHHAGKIGEFLNIDKGGS
jgi:Patatin-like phospholipase